VKRRSTISIEVIWNEKRSLSFDECVRSFHAYRSESSKVFNLSWNGFQFTLNWINVISAPVYNATC
jgi:hypothetical protein